MILHICEAKYIKDYQIELKFNDGQCGVADLSSALHGPMFQSLLNVNEFSKLQLDPELETVVWPNGADLAPEYLYFQAFKDDSTLQEKFKAWGYIA